MPELKRVFSKGRMNKDLDERVVPNGEYRDANNIEVTTSEGSAVGTVQSVYGNIEKTIKGDSVGSLNYSLSHNVAFNSSTGSLGSNAECVGSIADEKNNKIYSLIRDGAWWINGTSYESDDYLVIYSDYILEYDVSSTDTYPYKYVFNDIYKVETQTYASTAGNRISPLSNQGIREGMIATFETSDGVIHNIKVKHLFEDDSGSTTYSTDNVWLDDSYAGTLAANTKVVFEANRVLNFGGNFGTTQQAASKITGINIIDDLLFWTDNNSEPKK